MNGSGQYNGTHDRPEIDHDRLGPLSALSIAELAHLAILMLACEGYRHSVFELDLSIVEDFGRFLLTPRGYGISDRKWLADRSGTHFGRSVVSRFAVRFKRAASSMLIEYTRAAATKTPWEPRPSVPGTNRAIRPEDVTTR